MLGRGGLVAAALAMATVAPANTAAPLWSFVRALEPDDPAAAVQRADEVWGVAHGLSTEFRVDEDSARLLRRIRDAMLGINLRRLHRLLPVDEGATRRLLASGHAEGHGWYALTLSGGDGDPPSRLGELGAAMSLTQRPDHEYGVTVRAGVGTEALDHHEMAGALEEGLRQLELQSGDDLSRVVSASFPHTAEAWGRVGTPASLGRIEQGVLAIDATLGLDLEAPGWEGLPHLARYLRRLDDLLELSIEVHDPAGRVVASVLFDTASTRMHVSVATHNGDLVPRSAAGVMQPDSALQIRAAQPLALHVVIAATVRFRGVRMQLDRLDLPVRWEFARGHAALTARIDEVPRLRIEGTGAFTSWLVDVMEGAFDLSEHTEALMRAVSHGPSGLGTPFQLGYRDSVVSFEVDTLLVDNGLVRFGAQIVGGRLVPDDRALEELGRLVSAGIGAVGADYLENRDGLLRDVRSTDGG